MSETPEHYSACVECGHRRGTHVGPGGACWYVDDTVCGCDGYVEPA